MKYIRVEVSRVSYAPVIVAVPDDFDPADLEKAEYAGALAVAARDQRPWWDHDESLSVDSDTAEPLTEVEVAGLREGKWCDLKAVQARVADAYCQHADAGSGPGEALLRAVAEVSQ